MPSDYPPCEGCPLDAECAEWRQEHPCELCLVQYWRCHADAEARAGYAAAGIALPEVGA